MGKLHLGRDSNPFVEYSEYDKGHVVGFLVLRGSRQDEPLLLMWTGRGFKNLDRVGSEPEHFATRADAVAKIKGELLDFIRRWRGSDAEFIVGW